MGTRLKEKLITQYFKTEVIENDVGDGDAELRDYDPKIVRAAFEFLENPDEEPDHFIAESIINDHTYVTE